jgi:hypothetical protein
VLATQQKGNEHGEKLEGKGDSIGEVGMDRVEVNRVEWVVDILAFRLAQAIVSKVSFVGSGEGIVAGGGEWLFVHIDMLSEWALRRVDSTCRSKGDLTAG